MKYFSETEKGALPRTVNEIPHNVWCGMVSYVKSLIDNGYLAEHFPEQCPDGQGCCGTNEEALEKALLAEIPELNWPLLTEKNDEPESWMSKKQPYVEEYLVVLDFVQFCYEHVSKPQKGSYHSFFQHYHLVNFDRDAGRQQFLEKINRIFARNGLVYELQENGDIVRILNPILTQVVGDTAIHTRDNDLNQMLRSAGSRISNPDIRIRYDALKDLWDAWERLKTLKEPSKSKKHSIGSLLDCAATNAEFRTELETEAKALTDIGNSFFIRHSEVTQIKLEDSDHIDYLFHRLSSMVCLLVAKLS